MSDQPVIVRTQAEVQRMLRACIKTAQEAGLPIAGLEVEIQSDRFRAAVICSNPTSAQVARLREEDSPDHWHSTPGNLKELEEAFRRHMEASLRRSEVRRKNKEARAAAAKKAETKD